MSSEEALSYGVIDEIIGVKNDGKSKNTKKK